MKYKFDPKTLYENPDFYSASYGKFGAVLFIKAIREIFGIPLKTAKFDLADVLFPMFEGERAPSKNPLVIELPETSSKLPDGISKVTSHGVSEGILRDATREMIDNEDYEGAISVLKTLLTIT